MMHGLFLERDGLFLREGWVVPKRGMGSSLMRDGLFLNDGWVVPH